MGLLDDAIREHLDLKRRRGADADEVARQENEALGPPRTGEFATPADPGDAPQAPHEDTGERPAAVAAGPAGDEPPRDDVADEDAWLDEPVDVRDEAPARPDQATTEFTPPNVEPAPSAAGDDVLEETPDFLQETPEHDRLWFEQRPPRDFDFDK